LLDKFDVRLWLRAVLRWLISISDTKSRAVRGF